MVNRNIGLLNLISFVCFVTAGCLATILGSIIAAKLTYPQLYPDPFVTYEIIMFRQSVDDHLCIAQWQDNFTHQTTCEMQPKSRIFDKVNILRCDCDPPTFEIAFWSRHLQVADLVRRWGRPDTITIVHNGNHYLLQWNTIQVEAYTLRGARFTYQANAQLVRWHE
jgi:hypothetical protein